MTLKERVRLILVTLLVALVLLFFIQNNETVQVAFLWGTFALPRFVMLPGLLLLGFVAGYLVARLRRHGR